MAVISIHVTISLILFTISFTDFPASLSFILDKRFFSSLFMLRKIIL